MATRHLLAAAALGALALTAASAESRPRASATRSFDMTAQDAWSRVNGYLSANGVKVRGGPRPGTLMASGDSRQGEFVKCRARKGDVRAISYDMTIMVESGSRGGAAVTVLLDGDAINARRNHLLFIPTTVKKIPIDCATTGRFERELFAYLSHG